MVSIEDVIKVLGEAGTLGTTTKQTAMKINVNKEIIAEHLKILRETNRITRIGRDLWILKQFEDITNDPNFIPPEYYVKKFKNNHKDISFVKFRQKITFSENGEKRIHRWSPYIQGFSASFVDEILSRYNLGKGDVILDPFVGSGTVLVCAKMKGVDSIGVDLMPLLTFMAKVKTTWDIDVEIIENELKRVIRICNNNGEGTLIPFLKETSRHFNEKVLDNLLILKKAILRVQDHKIRNLFLLAFASILVSCSNLKRSPCLGYVKNKKVTKDAPFTYFQNKIVQMTEDLKFIQKQNGKWGSIKIFTADAKTMTYDKPIDFAITSPPYVNGMDYVTNYKIEMAWLSQSLEKAIKSYKDLQTLRNNMVSCDNISRNTIREFSLRKHRFDDEWLDKIVEDINERVARKGNYRRDDMHLIVKKYFEDLYQTYEHVYEGLREDGRLVIVIGDSLIAGTYIPTDLILARMGEKVGFKVEDIEVARERRSGQRRRFKLRESIITLTKGIPKRKVKQLSDFL